MGIEATLKQMTSTDFAAFFDFSICPAEDDDWDEYQYAVTDDQGVLPARLITNAEDITGCFDSLHNDYIIEYLKEKGMPGFINFRDVEAWITTDYPDLIGSDLYRVVCCLNDSSNIVNDIDSDIDVDNDEDMEL